MTETHNAKKVGRRDVAIGLHWVVALDDPTACGNMGLEGADDDWWYTVRPNLGLARHAARKYVQDKLLDKPKITVLDVRFTEREWVADSWDDRDHGHVRDAVAEERFITDGAWDNDTNDFTYDDRYSCESYV